MNLNPRLTGKHASLICSIVTGILLVEFDLRLIVGLLALIMSYHFWFHHKE